MPFFNIPGGGSGESNSFPVLTGQGAPSDSIGADGQLFIDALNGLLYVKDGGTWGAGISVGVDEWSELIGKPTEFPPASHGHVVADVDGLQALIDGKAAAQHGHAIADVDGLGTALDGKADAIHTHEIAAVNGLQTALDNLAAGGAGVAWSDVPATPTTTAAAGSIAYNSSHLFVAVAANNWKRVALTDWVVSSITITQQPADQTASGGAATFTVAATVSGGGSVTYQWQSSLDAGSTWSNISGATTATLALTGLQISDDGTQYRAVVSATGTASVPSAAATLTVTVSPSGDNLQAESGDILQTEAGEWLQHDGTVSNTATITISEQPQDKFQTLPESGGIASLTVGAVSASASNGAELQYQWQVLTNAANAQWSNVNTYSGTPSLFVLQNILSELENWQYRVIISAEGAASVTSDAAAINVLQPEGYLTIPRSELNAWRAATSGFPNFAYIWIESLEQVHGISSPLQYMRAAVQETDFLDNVVSYIQPWSGSTSFDTNEDVRLPLPLSIHHTAVASNSIKTGSLVRAVVTDSYYGNGSNAWASGVWTDSGTSRTITFPQQNPDQYLSQTAGGVGDQIRLPYDVYTVLTGRTISLEFRVNTGNVDPDYESQSTKDARTYVVEYRQSESDPWAPVSTPANTWLPGIRGSADPERTTDYFLAADANTPYRWFALPGDDGGQFRIRFSHPDTADDYYTPTTTIRVVPNTSDTLSIAAQPTPGEWQSNNNLYTATLSASCTHVIQAWLPIQPTWQVSGSENGPWIDVDSSIDINANYQVVNTAQTLSGKNYVSTSLTAEYLNQPPASTYFRCVFSNYGYAPFITSDVVAVSVPPPSISVTVQPQDTTAGFADGNNRVAVLAMSASSTVEMVADWQISTSVAGPWETMQLDENVNGVKRMQQTTTSGGLVLHEVVDQQQFNPTYELNSSIEITHNGAWMGDFYYRCKITSADESAIEYTNAVRVFP